VSIDFYGGTLIKVLISHQHCQILHCTRLLLILYVQEPADQTSLNFEWALPHTQGLLLTHALSVYFVMGSDRTWTVCYQKNENGSFANKGWKDNDKALTFNQESETNFSWTQLTLFYLVRKVEKKIHQLFEAGCTWS